uniref:Uncharacterized protein n=1 Tax=Zea mays TaxID=4577 RepID=A0A804RHJ3_MAIZE
MTGAVVGGCWVTRTLAGPMGFRDLSGETTLGGSSDIGERAAAWASARRRRAERWLGFGGESGCTTLSIFKQGDLMVVANADDSWVVLGTATDDDAVTPSSSSYT